MYDQRQLKLSCQADKLLRTAPAGPWQRQIAVIIEADLSDGFYFLEAASERSVAMSSCRKSLASCGWQPMTAKMFWNWAARFTELIDR